MLIWTGFSLQPTTISTPGYYVKLPVYEGEMKSISLIKISLTH